MKAHSRGERTDQVCADNVDPSSGLAIADPGYSDWLAQVGLSGSGVIMANVDEGVQNTHPDLAARMLVCVGSTCGGSASSNHGTHVAGIMSGDGSSGTTDQSGFLLGLGVAPGSGLIEQLYPTESIVTPQNVMLRIQESKLNQAVLSNNSWGWAGGDLDQPSACGYDPPTRQIDIGVRDANPDAPGNQPLIYVLAVANGGFGISTQGAPDEAKNVIAVGATMVRQSVGDAYTNDDLCGVGAHGPACDGRLLPHIVAPGCAVDSTWAGLPFTFPPSCVGQAYCWTPGTSMAAPHVSGAIALLVDYYRTLPGISQDPSPALVKAALTGVGYNLVEHSDGGAGLLPHRPDSEQGWGRLNLSGMVDPVLPVLYFDGPQLFNSTGEQWTKRVAPSDPSKDLRVMLAWTDAPGPGLGACPMSNCIASQCCAEGANAAPAWVNDLDLVVLRNGATYKGNVFNGISGWSLSGAGNADFKNNTEGVFIGPAVGAVSHEIRVVAANIAGDGVPGVGDSTDQDFALVCYNCAPDCNANGIADLTDLTSGTSPDCNSNTIPDECDPQPVKIAFVASSPVDESSWWRTQKNIARLTFACNIGAPVSGAVPIQEMLEGGSFGATDLSPQFNYTVQNDSQGRPRVLRIRENTSTVQHRKWYAIRNTGAWSGVADFKVEYVIQKGDANADKAVTFTDVTVVNSSPSGPVPDDSRFDINGDGFKTPTDVGQANAFVPSDPVAKPGGH